jgi:UDP-3-O-[3-hydroxymyristoyl] glucosamine N-acyltransferase
VSAGAVTFTAAELAAELGGVVEGDPAQRVSGIGRLEDAQPGELSFFANQRYRAALQKSRASVILVGRDAVLGAMAKTWIRVDQPHLAYARLAQRFHPPRPPPPGVGRGARVDATAQVAPNATVMDGATVSARAVVGARSILYPGVYLGEGARVGEDTVLRPNVVVMDGCVVGHRCLIHPGAVIGADGFGFALDASVPEHVKIPQVGIVRVEDDVEIGACSCVDRATSGETVIGKGSKIDNLVQVGHNSVIGPLSILCAQVGLSGSTELGTGVMLGGQAGTAGHQRIGDLAKVAARGAVLGDLDAGAVVAGVPAFPHKDWLRSVAAFPRLPELLKALRAVENRLAALEEENRK